MSCFRGIIFLRGAVFLRGEMTRTLALFSAGSRHITDPPEVRFLRSDINSDNFGIFYWRFILKL